MKVTISFDGASRDGQGAIGYTIRAPFRTVENAEPIGPATNNEAEWTALVKALEHAHDLGATAATIVGDSQLVVRQVRGEYQVRADNLKPMFEQATELLDGLDRWEIHHTGRENNERADELAASALT